MTHDGFSAELCSTLSKICFYDLPPEVVSRIQLFLLDTLGTIGGAANVPTVRNLNKTLVAWNKHGQCTSLVGGWKGSPPSAAMANATAAHALDFDDQHDPARTHSYCVVFPAVLASAEAIGGIDGKRFIAAVAVGVEMHARLGLACYNSLSRGWHPTAALGSLASAFATAHLIGLNDVGTLDALGLAYHQMSGTKQPLLDSVPTKQLGAGFAARNGVTAAFYANDGLVGTRRPLEGEAGLFTLYERGEVDIAAITDGLGKRWELLEVSMKPYPCCRANHSTIQLALELRERGISASDISHAVISIGAVNHSVVGYNYAPKTTTNQIVHAQFNAAYSFARALIDGQINLDSYHPAKVIEPALLTLIDKLEVVVDPDVDARALAPSRADIIDNEGVSRSFVRTKVKGSPEEPMEEQEVLEKYFSNMKFGLGAKISDLDALAEITLGLADNDDAVSLVKYFPENKITN